MYIPSLKIRADPTAHPLRRELLDTELLPYQLDGIAFAVGAGRAILADDMGLGKTIQAIGVAELLRREFGIRKVLVVCPASLKSQWRNEIERFSRQTCQLVMGAAASLAPILAIYVLDACFLDRHLRGDPASRWIPASGTTLSVYLWTLAVAIGRRSEWQAGVAGAVVCLGWIVYMNVADFVENVSMRFLHEANPGRKKSGRQVPSQVRSPSDHDARRSRRHSNTGRVGRQGIGCCRRGEGRAGLRSRYRLREARATEPIPRHWYQCLHRDVTQASTGMLQGWSETTTDRSWQQ